MSTYESPAPQSTSAVVEQLTKIGQAVARLESAATERRWADCYDAARSCLGDLQKIMQRAQVLAQLQADGTIPR